MRRSSFQLSAAVLLLLAGPALADSCPTLQSLEWLLGEWGGGNKKSKFRETWVARGPATWEGKGVETSREDDEKVSYEDLRLVEMTGGVYYVAKVSHNDLPVAFRLTECARGRFAFVNPAHDFPKRIEYERQRDDAMVVRVSDGADKGFTIDLARIMGPAATADAVVSAENARFAAMVAADPEAMRRWLAEDLSYAHSTGRVENREQLIESIVSGKLRYLAIEPAERQVWFQGSETAIVEGIARVQARAGDQGVDFSARYLAVYGLQDRDWRLRAWQSLRLP